jgi:hypothetical protein
MTVKAREIFAPLPEGVTIQGRHNLSGYYIIGNEKSDADKLFDLNQVPNFRKFIANCIGSKETDYQLISLEVTEIKNISKHPKTFDNYHQIIGIRRSGYISSFGEKKTNELMENTQKVVDAMNHYFGEKLPHILR